MHPDPHSPPSEADARGEFFTVERTLPHDRLDTFLRERYPQASRGAVQRMIEEGHIQVNGRKVKPTYTPKAGDQVRVHWPDARASVLEPVALPLEILYEDGDLVVVNKPPGLVVHPASGTERETLVHALLHHCRGQLSGIGGVERPGIVHRLDKNTSGCIVVAKHDVSHRALADQFRDRVVEKTYWAIVCGHLRAPAGDIRAAIARHPNHRKCMAVTRDRGRDAWTSYRVLEPLRLTSLVEIQIHTGRTHQIRVHFNHVGHPLLGDDTYGTRASARVVATTGYEPARVMLHSFCLSFRHPDSGRTMKFEAPLPEDFKEALETLKISASK